MSFLQNLTTWLSGVWTGISTWFGKQLDKLLSWIVSTNAWVMFARHWMAYFTFRVFGYCKFPLENYFDVLKVFEAQPDGIYAFVAADPNGLSFVVNHWVTGCIWGHAGIVRKEGQGLYAWHMKSQGLLHWHLLDIMHECDRFALLRLPIDGANNIALANARLDAIINAPLVPYNYSFSMPTDVINWLQTGQPLTGDDTQQLQSLKLYCSEMVYVIGVGLADNPKWAAQWEYGAQVFQPDNLYADAEIIYEFRAD